MERESFRDSTTVFTQEEILELIPDLEYQISWEEIYRLNIIISLLEKGYGKAEIKDKLKISG